MTIDADKLAFAGKPKFRLRRATIFQSGDGYTFSKYLDGTGEPAPRRALSAAETGRLHAYLETQLQHNKDRFRRLVAIVRGHSPDTSSKVLDVGCGGGEFLKLAKESGYDVSGVEMDPNRAAYCREKHGCTIYEKEISDAFFADRRGAFEVVTLWDVIEHVNFPYKTLTAIHEILAPAGVLYIDTPAKDSFYHRFGELTYALTFGKAPTFLNIMYSEHPFGHKQIFSTAEMTAILTSVGFEIVRVEKFHELSFPYRYYLKKMLRSDLAAKIIAPLVSLFFMFFRIKNKMLVVARKKGASTMAEARTEARRLLAVAE